MNANQKLTEATTDDFAPQYVFTPRLVGHLARGELAIEPLLGAARVARVRHDDRTDPPGGPDRTFNDGFVHVTWRHEHGPGQATARYPTHRSFEVRMPHPADRLLVRRGIDQAVWLGRQISDTTARLIAAHLHTGPPSALHRFMLDGSISESFHDELEAITTHRRYAREWAAAMLRYCQTRPDPGPIASWTRHAMNQAETRAEAWLSAAGIHVHDLPHQPKADHHEATRPQRYQSLLRRKTMKTETAAQLIDAAFTLGLLAGRSRASSRTRHLIRSHKLNAAA